MCRPDDFPPYDDEFSREIEKMGTPARPYIDMLDVVDPKQRPSWDSTPYVPKERPMTTPTTEAGKRLLAKGYCDEGQIIFPDDIAAIEAEAARLTLDGMATLLGQLPPLDKMSKVELERMVGMVREAAGREAVNAALDRVAARMRHIKVAHDHPESSLCLPAFCVAGHRAAVLRAIEEARPKP